MSGRGSWRSARFLVVDVETTGLDPSRDEIVSFAGVPVEEGRALAGAAVSGLVRPSAAPAPSSIEIHGLRAADLAAAPEAARGAARRSRRRLRGRTPVAHAAWVERAFLRPPLRALGTRLPRRIVDTALLWRLLCIMRGDGDPGWTPLAAVAGGLGCPPTARTSPRATRSRPRRCSWRSPRTSRRTGRGRVRDLTGAAWFVRGWKLCARVTRAGQLRLNAARISRWNSSTCSRMIVRARSPSRSSRAFSRCIWSWTEWPRPGTRSSTRYQMRSEWVK